MKNCGERWEGKSDEFFLLAFCLRAATGCPDDYDYSRRVASRKCLRENLLLRRELPGELIKIGKVATAKRRRNKNFFSYRALHVNASSSSSSFSLISASIYEYFVYIMYYNAC